MMRRALVYASLVGVISASTTLSAGSCPVGASWSDWRSESEPTGHCDYEGLSRHTTWRMSILNQGQPGTEAVRDRLVCNTLYGVEGRVVSTGATVTDQVVRFGIDVDMELVTTLDLWNVESGWSNPRFDEGFLATDSGLMCWNEEQPEWDPTGPFGWPGFSPDNPICHEYDVRFCCADEPVVTTTLSAGSCAAGHSWSDWRSEDDLWGYGDFEHLSFHKYGHHWNDGRKTRSGDDDKTPILSNKLSCPNPTGVEGRNKDTGATSTNLNVRFGVNVNMDRLPVHYQVDLSSWNEYDPTDLSGYETVDTGLICYKEEQVDFTCEDFEVRFCCEDAPVTTLSAGTCPGTASWSAWRSEDGASGHVDYEGFSRHTSWRMSHFWNMPPIDRLVCNTLYGVEGKNLRTGLSETSQVVRFGLDQYMDLPTTLNLQNVESGWQNPRYGSEFLATDSGLLCWNEEQPEVDPFNWPGFSPDNPICDEYEVRFCCEDEPVVTTQLDVGSCTAGTHEWSDWRNEDTDDGYGDFEALSWHTYKHRALQGKTHIFPPNRLSCPGLTGVQGRNRNNGATSTTKNVRFGIDVLMDRQAQFIATIDMSNDGWTDPMGLSGYQSIDSGLVCYREEQYDLDCDDFEVRFCCEKPPTTLLKSGNCPAGASWSEWRSEDESSGHVDYEGFSRHTSFRMDHFWNFPPIDRLVCDTLHAVEGLNMRTGLSETSQVVRFGINVYMDLETTLNLQNVESGWQNPRYGSEFLAVDSGLLCWNEEQPEMDPYNWPGFSPDNPICDEYQVRFCCEDVVAEPTVLSVGTCDDAGDTWSAWMNQDGPSGFADLESMQWHEDTYTCNGEIVAVEGWDRTTGSAQTDLVVRFGIDVNIDFPSTLDLSNWNMNNPRNNAGYRAIDTGLVCWREEQPDFTCHDYEVRYCCHEDVSTTVAATTTAPATTTTAAQTTTTAWTPRTNPVADGICWSGNWTLFMNQDDPSDGEDTELFAMYQGLNMTNGCLEIAAVEVRALADADANQTLILDGQIGAICKDSDNMPEGCLDYEVRFCCEGCCPQLNVSGNAELTDYYEDYPGIYELQTEMFNDMITYKQVLGLDEAGATVYGQGIIYYWADVGWLLGANTFTYSYFSDGIGQRCPQFAPSNWTNEVYGTQLNVECLPIYPSCNDVDCVANSYCQMLDNGPECICEPGFTEYEDGQCLKPEGKMTWEDGECGPNDEWTGWMNSDDASGMGDWELLGGFAQSMVCLNPSAVEAHRVDHATSPALVAHISKELGFWCVHSEQGGVDCGDFEVRFCCPKWSAGSDCGEDNYEWTGWLNQDAPTSTGDWETTSYFGENDVCSNPIGIEAHVVIGSAGEYGVTHIDSDVGFWCLNAENNNNCADFEARFCCPSLASGAGGAYVMDGTCDDDDYMWTGWLNSDSPAGSDGDWETLGNMARMNVCAAPSGIQARSDGPGAMDNVHIHKEAGFWCINDENTGQCADFEVRFCCPRYKTGECDDKGHAWTGWYNDEWNKKNERLWVSNRQELEMLQAYGDGAACAAPTESEIRVRPTGSTSFQTTMWEYSTHLIQHLTPAGYACYNEEQGEFDADGVRYRCVDMEIRFCCPTDFKAGDCDQPGYEWTGWLDNDTPDEDGDWETLSSFDSNVACNNPIAVEAQPTNLGSTEYTHIDTSMGFYCLNEEQSYGGLCANFEVRYCCPKMQLGECDTKGFEWTAWLDRDDPVGTGDWENLHAYEPNQACAAPVAVRAMDNLVGTSGNSDAVTHLDLSGFYCINDEQTNGLDCSDFSVSFCCPVDEVVTCETAHCDANEWCLETPAGPICKCGDDDFSDDWDEVDFVEQEDGECLPVASPIVNSTVTAGECTTAGYEWTSPMNKDDPTGDGDFEYFHMFNSNEACNNPTGIRATFTDSGAGSWPIHIDMVMGFWCVNDEQTGGACEDFSVEFCCPKTATGDCSEAGYEWSEFYNVDDPSDSGDWELRSDQMCANPIAVKAETVSGDVFNNMTHIDNEIGFWCINDENAESLGCQDYKVSFCCPGLSEGSCDSYGYSWGEYLDVDDPDGLGDMEVKTSFSEFEVCNAPTGIVAREMVSTDNGVLGAGPFTRISVEEGFVCQNDVFNTCADFEVSWCCPKWGVGNLHCDKKGYEWTSWINNDHPSTSTGDWETRTSYAERSVCSHPIGVQAYPTGSGSTAVTHIDEDVGFWCVNEEQPTEDCADFAVRFCCPQFVQGSCNEDGYEWTAFLDRDDPTENGDYETLQDYSTDDVCQNPIALEAQARSSGSTAVTHVSLDWGFWCNNDENEGGCADFEVRFCCPKTSEITCEQEGYEWTVWLDRDDPTDTGDWENKDGFSANVVCATPTAVQAQVKSGSTGSTAVTHLDNDQGFWCIHDEQPKDEACADFEVRFCCPEEYRNPCGSVNLLCGDNQHVVYESLDETTDECVCACDQGYVINSITTKVDENWICENTHGTCVRLYKDQKSWTDANDYCQSINADLVTVYDATYQAWLDLMWDGAYWFGLNDQTLADNWVNSNGDITTYTNWSPGHPLPIEPYNCGQVASYGSWLSGLCDAPTEFFCMIKQTTQECVMDTSCQASLTECVDFDECINKNDALTVTGQTTDTVTVTCADSDAYPANNGGTDGVLTCVCDGKNECVWESDDFVGELTEDGMCLTDHVCPVTVFKEYEGELQFTRNRFINDATHNTLQADLYDSSKAEVLGRIETTAIANFDTNWDWSTGHYLVIVWPNVLPDHVEICPYGDYYDAYESFYNDGEVQVFETFTNPLVLRDGSLRDVTNNNMEVVLDVRHDHDLDVEDITDLLVFRIALVPKTWQDEYGDWIKKTAKEVSECLNAMHNHQAKVDGALRKNKKKTKTTTAPPAKPTQAAAAPPAQPTQAAVKPAKPAVNNKWKQNNKGVSNKWKNNKNKKNQAKKPSAWKLKQEKRKQRLAMESMKA